MIRVHLIIIIIFFACQPSNTDIIEVEDSKELILEGIVINPTSNEIYLSSINKDKIVSVNMQGQITSEILNIENNDYTIGLGMEFYKNKLYALSSHKRSSQYMLTIKDMSTGIFNNYINTEKDTSLFNDLAIDQYGNAFITDSKNHKIYKFDAKQKEIQSYLESDQFYYPNGIAINEKETKLFVASSSHGIRIIDLKSKTIINPIHQQTKDTGVDGLKYKEGTLYFVMNSRGEDKIIRGLYSIELIDDETSFGEMKEIWVNQDISPSPTTIAINENTIYLLGNSQLENYNEEEGGIIDSEQLENIKLVIIKI